ncbi:MAG: hypothetical protein J6D57_07220, partial [Mogibacterium sp.]|nr:hypothetical protein [Mogibacterium sp.]
MRSDRDKRTDSEREIDDFLSQFETPVDELSADINSYLETADTTKMTAARTFYGAKYREVTRDQAPASLSSVEESPAAAVAPAAEKAAPAAAAAPVEKPAAEKTAPASDGVKKKKKKKKK